MHNLTASEARTELPHLIGEAGRTHEPIAITGAEHSVVLVAREDWDAVQETLALVSIPGMWESIGEGMETRVKACEKIY